MADKIIGFEDLFNFDDNTPIEKGIESIERLKTVYGQLVKYLQNQNNEIGGSMVLLVREVDKLELALRNINPSLKEGQEQAIKFASRVEVLSKNFSESKKSIEENNKAVKSLSDESKRLATVQQDFSKAQEAVASASGKASESLKEGAKAASVQAGSLADLKAQLKDAQKEYEGLSESQKEIAGPAILKRITELNKGITAGNTAITDAKKGIDIAKGSYVELDREVKQLNAELKNLPDAFGKNADRAKELQKVIFDKTQTLKDFDKAINVTNRNVGNYAEGVREGIEASGLFSQELGALKNVQDKLNGVLKVVTAQYKLQATESARIAAIKRAEATAQARQHAEFMAQKAREGAATKLAVMQAQAQAAATAAIGKANIVAATTFNILKVAIASTGIGLLLLGVAALISYFTQFDAGIKKWEQGMAAFGAVVNVVVQTLGKFGETIVDSFTALIAYLKQPKEVLKDFVNFLQGQVMNRLKAFGVIVEAISKNDFKAAVNGIAQLGTGVEDVVGKGERGFANMSDKVKELGNNLVDAASSAAQLTKEMQELEDIEIEYRLQAEKNKGIVEQALLASKDRTLSEAERVKRLKEANEIEKRDSEQILEYERERLRILEGQFEFTKKDTAARKVVVDQLLVVQRLENETAATQQKLNNRLSAFNDELKKQREEMHKARMEQIKREQQALDNLQLYELDQAAKEREQLAQHEKNYFERVRLYNEAKEARVQIATIEKDQLLRQENLLDAERELIIRKFEARLKALDEEFIVKIKVDIDDFELPKLEDEETSFFNSAKAIKEFDLYAKQRMKAANELRDGSVEGERKYSEAVAKIDDEILQNKINALKAEFGYTEEILDLEYQLEQKQKDRIIAIREERNERIEALSIAIFDSTLSIIDSINEREEQKRAERLESLKTQYEAELQMAGDNAEAKARITADFQKKEKQALEESAKAKRKQAIFDKVVAAASIGIDTARGIAKTIGQVGLPVAIPLVATIAAIGAVQLAAVLAKPIPQFFKGTESSPEGLAWVGEKGFELMEKPSEKGTYYKSPSKPTLTYLERGTKIHTHEKSKEIIREMETQKFKEINTRQFINNTKAHFKRGENIAIKASNQKIDNRELADQIAKSMTFHFSRLVEAYRKNPSMHLFESIDEGIKGLNDLQNKKSTLDYLTRKFRN